MKRALVALMFATTLVAAARSHAGSPEMEANWMGLIRTDFDRLCAVQRTKVGTVVAGNNGVRKEQWFLRTCDGDVEYWVSYYPPSAFPERGTPYEVERRFVVPLVTCVHLAEDHVTRTRGWPKDSYTIREARPVTGGRGFEIWYKADTGKRRPPGGYGTSFHLELDADCSKVVQEFKYQ